MGIGDFYGYGYKSGYRSAAAANKVTTSNESCFRRRPMERVQGREFAGELSHTVTVQMTVDE